MMRDYLHEDNRKGRRTAALATALYVALWAMMFLFLSFQVEQNVEEQGIMIDFGTSQTGLGELDTPLAEKQAQMSQSEQAAADKELLTQDIEDAVAIKKSKKKSETTTPAEKPKVNKSALFPGRTMGTTAKSEGVKGGEGNQGSEKGQVGANHDGTGGNGTSGRADLDGRDIIGILPSPAYNANESGRVIINIVVDREGKVTSATFRPVGSTTQNSTLVEAARRAAIKARFTPAENQDVQQGTITYNFKLR